MKIYKTCAPYFRTGNGAHRAEAINRHWGDTSHVLNSQGKSWELSWAPKHPLPLLLSYGLSSLDHFFFCSACPLGHDPTCTQGLLSPQDHLNGWSGQKWWRVCRSHAHRACGFSKRTRTHVPSRKWKWKNLQEVRTDWVSLWKTELVHVRSLVRGKWKCVRDH